MPLLSSTRTVALRSGRQGSKLSSYGGIVLASAGVLLFILVILVPFYYVLLSSFKDNQEIFIDPLGLPSDFSLSNYADALRI